MKYSCPQCQYETNIKCNFDKHVSTQKHRDKVAQPPEVVRNLSESGANPTRYKVKRAPKTEANFVCAFCQSGFTLLTNLTRHKKTCDEKSNLIESYTKREADLKKDHEREIAEIKLRHEMEMIGIKANYSIEMAGIIRDYEVRLATNILTERDLRR